ncbi:MAG: 50S ribosomal protein L29 [Cytophagales bacterium]|nr:50S ribosomal protein L29 [Cytophagales bacterium]
MKNSEIKALTVEQLAEKVKEEASALQKMKFAHAVTPLENPMQIRQSRKLIARLKTELTAKSK